MENLNEINQQETFIEGSDVVVNPESGLAIVVVKPDAFAKRGQIVKRLEGSGLYVVKEVEKRLPDDFVIGTMYKGLPKGLEVETLKHFNSGPSDLILLRGGKDILEKIVTIVGTKTVPTECDEQSIRYLYGEHFSRDAGGDLKYSRNGAHRSMTQAERDEDLKKFESFF
jgi:nucleoside diphosphate kinase